MMDNVSSQLQKCLSLEKEASELGCSRTSLLWTEDIVFDPRVTLKCKQNLCTHYGNNFMCPPYVQENIDYFQCVNKYKIALLIQKEKELQANLSTEEIAAEYKTLFLDILDIILSLEKRAFNLGFTFSMGLGSGNCKLCDACAAKTGGQACINPQKARPSMEAVGIDVLRTCAGANFPLDFQSQKISGTGLILLI